MTFIDEIWKTSALWRPRSVFISSLHGTIRLWRFLSLSLLSSFQWPLTISLDRKDIRPSYLYQSFISSRCVWGRRPPSLSRCLSVSLSLIYVFTYICLFFCLWLCKYSWTPLLTEFCLLILCHFSLFSFISSNGPNRIPPLANQRC